MNKITYILIPAFVAVLFFPAPQALSQLKDEAKEIVEVKEVTGEMVFLTGRMITVELSRTETGSTEILIPYDEEVTLNRLRSMDDLKQGDTVKVTYEESYMEGEDGKRLNFKRTATDIALIKPAAKGLRSME